MYIVGGCIWNCHPEYTNVYQSISFVDFNVLYLTHWSWHGSCHLSNMEIRLTLGVNGQQGMLTPPWHLIPPLIYSEVRVPPFSDLYFLWDLWDWLLIIIFVISYCKIWINITIFPQPKEQKSPNKKKNGKENISIKDGIYVFSSPELKSQVSYSDRLLSIVRLSLRMLPVNFYIFDFFSRTTGPILIKLGTNHP
jgi:hypothetical protein